MSETFDMVMKEFKRVQSRIDELRPLLKINKEAFNAAKAAGEKDKMKELALERDRIETQLHPLKEDIYALNIKAQEFKPGFDWFDYLRAQKSEAQVQPMAQAEQSSPEQQAGA